MLNTDGDVDMDGLMLFSLFVGVIAFTLLYVWLMMHRTRVMAMEDLIDDRGLDEPWPRAAARARPDRLALPGPNSRQSRTE